MQSELPIINWNLIDQTMSLGMFDVICNQRKKSIKESGFTQVWKIQDVWAGSSPSFNNYSCCFFLSFNTHLQPHTEFHKQEEIKWMDAAIDSVTVNDSSKGKYSPWVKVQMVYIVFHFGLKDGWLIGNCWWFDWMIIDLEGTGLRDKYPKTSGKTHVDEPLRMGKHCEIFLYHVNVH